MAAFACQHDLSSSLLSLARTGAGEETPANWLKHPASVDEIRERQDAVRELTPALDLREALSVAGASIRAGVDTGSLTSWAEGGRWLRPVWLRQAAMLANGGTTRPRGAPLAAVLLHDLTASVGEGGLVVVSHR